MGNGVMLVPRHKSEIQNLSVQLYIYKAYVNRYVRGIPITRMQDGRTNRRADWDNDSITQLPLESASIIETLFFMYKRRQL